MPCHSRIYKQKKIIFLTKLRAALLILSTFSFYINDIIFLFCWVLNHSDNVTFQLYQWRKTSVAPSCCSDLRFLSYKKPGQLSWLKCQSCKLEVVGSYPTLGACSSKLQQCIISVMIEPLSSSAQLDSFHQVKESNVTCSIQLHNDEGHVTHS